MEPKTLLSASCIPSRQHDLCSSSFIAMSLIYGAFQSSTRSLEATPGTIGTYPSNTAALAIQSLADAQEFFFVRGQLSRPFNCLRSREPWDTLVLAPYNSTPRCGCSISRCSPISKNSTRPFPWSLVPLSPIPDMQYCCTFLRPLSRPPFWPLFSATLSFDPRRGHKVAWPCYL